jgi:opacity protein-like surface antigen
LTKLTLIVFASLFALCSAAQEVAPKQSFGATASFAASSSHIIIGDAYKRQITTAGVEYAYTFLRSDSLALSYQASANPLFLERDPTVIGYYYTFNGTKTLIPAAPSRVLNTTSGALGVPNSNMDYPAPTYGIFSTEYTPGVAVAPVGLRANFLPRFRIQPVFSFDLGIVLTSRNVPLDNTDSFNFSFSLGPGIEYRVNRAESVRLDYQFRHISNAKVGNDDPGIDQGVFRLTVAHHW